jgi:radical SAM superfamily enzyme YgiQ (UPF0313 family)
MYNIILINPPVYDFTYYNLWEKPLGLLTIAAAFERDRRCRISFIDCVPERLAKKSEYERGAGRLTGAAAPKPECFKSVRRNYHRYGIPLDDLKARLEKIKAAGGGGAAGEKTAVLISAMMTYWYGGAFEAARAAREILPEAEICLGGIYARLMPEHAAAPALFDYIETGYEIRDICRNILRLLNIEPAGINDGRGGSESEGEGEGKYKIYPGCFDLIPTYHLLPELNNSAAMTASAGCPFSCSYCASKILYSEYKIKPAKAVVNELAYYKNTLKVSNAAFYDDALLHKKEEHFYIWADLWIKAGGGPENGFRLHLPNAVHAAAIDDKCARVMKAAGFKTVRLGYEFYDGALQKQSGGKVSGGALKNAVNNLLNAGFAKKDIGVYILFGHPQSRAAEIKNAVDFVLECGAAPNLALFSPIPKTRDGAKIFEAHPEILFEPLLQNKTVFFEMYSNIKYETYYELKQYIQRHDAA